MDFVVHSVIFGLLWSSHMMVAASKSDDMIASIQGACRVDARLCVGRLRNDYTMRTPDDTRALLADRTRLEQLVRDLYGVYNCSQDISFRPFCEDISVTDDIVYLGVADYLDNPEVMDNLVELSRSECLTNERKMYDMLDFMDDCKRDHDWLHVMAREVNCTGILSYLSCQTRAAEVCGEAAVTVAQSLGDYFLTMPTAYRDWYVNDEGVDLSSCVVASTEGTTTASIVRRLAQVVAYTNP